MRVLMTADAVGGVWSYAIDLSRLLTARGIGVVLAVMGPAPDASQRLRRRQLTISNCGIARTICEWFQEFPS